MQVYTNSDKCEYLTAGKFYDVDKISGNGEIAVITDDDGTKIAIKLTGGCHHIHGDDWIVLR